MKQDWLAKYRTWYACVITDKDALWVLCNWRMHNYARALRRVHARLSVEQRALSSAYRYDNWHLHLCNTVTKVKIISVWHHLVSMNNTSFVRFCTGARFDKHFACLLASLVYITAGIFNTTKELCLYILKNQNKPHCSSLCLFPFVYASICM